MQDDYAVVIGINWYPGLSHLDGPVNDAHNFRAWLLDAVGGNVPDRNIKMILSPATPDAMNRSNAKPARDMIIEAFEAILDQKDDRGRIGRRLYIYMSGHGFAPEVDDSALLMANASPRFIHHIPGRPYANWFHSSAKFDEIVLLMDCCRDDLSMAPFQPPPWREEHSTNAAYVKRYFVFATRPFQPAAEIPIFEAGKTQGIFTTAFLAALKMAKRDDEGKLWGQAVKDFVLNHMPKLAAGELYQEPVFEFNEDIVFSKAEAGRFSNEIETHIRFAKPGTRDVRIFDGKFNVIFEGKAAAPRPLIIRLKPGMYLLQELGTDNHETLEIIGSSDEVVNVDCAF